MRVWLLVVAMFCVVPSAHAEQRYAVVIGANPGWSSDRPLRYAEADAERMRDVLVALGSFAPDRVVMLADPDTSEVRATLRDLARTAKASSEDTLVFFYYSGHADNEHLHLRGDPLTFKELKASLRAMPSTLKLAVIDACKSGAVTRKGGTRVDEFEVDVDSPKLSGMVLLTSSGADELSQESRSLAGSVFTHHLVSGLRGAADDNGDKQVTVAEAYHYAYARTRADTATSGTPQRPAFQYELSGQGELVLAQLKVARTAKVTVPKGNGTKYVVLDSHDMRLVAEVRAQPDRDVDLTLAPGNYRLKKVMSDRLEVSSIVLAAGEAAAADRVAYKSAPLSEGIVKGSMLDLPPGEQRDWRRNQAYGLLASGQTRAALGIFDQLLREDNSDILAWRGRARALIRIAESYEKLNDHQRERLALNDALKADPLLTEDPSFKLWYQRLGELDARDKQSNEDRLKLEQDIKRNPRSIKSYGVGFEVFSARGLIAIDGMLVVKRIVFPRVALDLGTGGLDAGVTVAPFPSRWSPFLGVGAHMSFRKMGLDIGSQSSMIDINDQSYSGEEIFGLHFRAEAGGQYVSKAGFTTELGFALISFQDKAGRRVTQGWPVLHFGWLW